MNLPGRAERQIRVLWSVRIVGRVCDTLFPIRCLLLCSTISVDRDGGRYARRSCGTLVGCG